MEQGIRIREIIKGFWVRRWLLGLVALGIFVAGAVVVMGLPSEYKASATIAVRAQRPAVQILPATVTSQPEDRLKTLHAELLAAPLLAKVVEELQLYPKAKSMEDRVSTLRSQLELQQEGEDVFVVTATSTDPKLAAAIANRLPELYAEESRTERLGQATRVQEMFTAELAGLRKQLATEDSAVASFKAQQLGHLPEQLEGNLRGLDRISLLQERGIEAMLDARRRREALLSEEHDDATLLGRLHRRQEDLGKALLEARSQWTEEHPEVQRLERESAALSTQVKQAEGSQDGRNRELRAIEANLATLRTGQAELETQESDYRRKVEQTPQAADQLTRLTRERDATQTKYQALLERQVEADLDVDLERRQGGALFRVVAAALIPAHPAKPDRGTGLLLTLLAALTLSGLLGAGLEIGDDSIKDSDDARERLGVPVLAVVPRLSTAPSSLGIAERR
ncbi:MAG: Wzz/FepE/Etk N-terminal domain-containing protein [Deltaproteobacteria bacterium]